MEKSFWASDPFSFDIQWITPAIKAGLLERRKLYRSHGIRCNFSLRDN